MSYKAELDQVVVLAGGLSPEREVSLRSGHRVRDALVQAGIDAVVADADASLLATCGRTRPARYSRPSTVPAGTLSWRPLRMRPQRIPIRALLRPHKHWLGKRAVRRCI